MSVSTSMLAAFVTPALATAGAAAVSLPILIHLLARRRFKRIRWAAMDFLIDAEKRNRRRVRLEELILLALRCLAVLLVGFALARPYLSASDWASAWGGRRTERLIVIDDTFSMGHESEEGTPFSTAKAGVRRLIETLRREAPGDPVTVVRMSSPTSPTASSVYLDDAETEALLARVEALTLTQRAGDLDAVFKGLAELLGRDEGRINAAAYIFSDFQRRDWSPRDEAPSSSGGPAAPLVAWAGKERSLRIILVNVGHSDANNLAVTGLSVPGSLPVAGASTAVRATVSSFSSQTAENLPLSLTSGQHRPSTKTLPLVAEWQQAAVDIEAEFLAAGDESVRVEIPPDALPLDNVRYAAVEVVSAIRVLLVNGEPSADEFEDEVSLLRTALRPEGEVFSGQEVVVVDEAGLESAQLSGFHAVILANVYRVGASETEMLERFVRGGGGLIVFLGDQVDAVSYNAELYRDGEGLLPGRLGEAVSLSEPTRLVVVDRLHPALRALGGAEDPLGLSQVGIRSFVPVNMASGSPEIVERTQEDSRTARGDARTIARFTDADEHPAIIERSFGSGRVVLVTTSADKEWNNWPEHPTYLPIMTELLRHVARSGGPSNEQWVGSRIESELDATLYETDVIVRGPGYPDVPDATTTAIPSEDGNGLVVRWDRTETAGIYQFVLRRRGGGESTRLVAVNVDPTESDLTMVGDEALARTMAGAPYELVRGLDELGGATGEAKTEWWTPLVLAAIVVLMGEQFLAWRWGRKG